MIGEVTTIITALVLLPALMMLVERRKPEPEHAEASGAASP